MLLLCLYLVVGSHNMATATAPLARANTSRLSFSQLEQLWIQNGGSPTWAPTMAAVALAESGGNVGSLNNNASTGDYSVGLWQINYFGDLLAPRTAAYGTPQQLQTNPSLNAKAAVNLLGSGAGITNWRTDVAGAAVIANGGQPLTSAQAQQLVKSNNLGGVSSGTAGTGATTTNATGSASGPVSTSGCNSAVYLINASPIHLINQCQAKAIKGGLLALAGGILMLAGVALIISKTGIGKKAAEGVGLDIVANVVTSRAGIRNSPTPSRPQPRATRATKAKPYSDTREYNTKGGKPKGTYKGEPEDF